MTAAKMSHVDLQDATVTLLSVTGWSHLHVRRTRGKGNAYTTSTNIKGWPDLFCWSTRQPGRHLLIEVKVPPDDLSDDQAELRPQLIAAGFEYVVLTQNPGVLRVAGPTVGLFDDLPAILRRAA